MTTHSNKSGDTSNGRSSHARRTGHHIAHEKAAWVREAMAKHCYRQISQQR